MKRETLIASSIRFGFSKGPSISSCRVSKFHFVWSLVIITYQEGDDVDLGLEVRLT